MSRLYEIILQLNEFNLVNELYTFFPYPFTFLDSDSMNYENRRQFIEHERFVRLYLKVIIKLNIK